MKLSYIYYIVVITVCNTVFAQFEMKLNNELYLSKLNDNVYVVTHYFPWESNSLVVKSSDDEVVLIDTPYHTDATAILIDWINLNIKPKKITAINTGFHIDNLGGNQYLRNFGIDIYGSDKTCKLIDEKGIKSQQEIISWLKPDQHEIKKTYEQMVWVKPNRIFKILEDQILKIGNLNFEIYYPGETHSPDNIVVYIDEYKLLFGGCMVKSLSSNSLGFTGDANLKEWPYSMKKIYKKFYDSKIVIPHHGMWGDMSLVEHTINLLQK